MTGEDQLEEFEETMKDKFNVVHNVKFDKPSMNVAPKEIIVKEKLRDELADKLIVKEIKKEPKKKDTGKKPTHDLW